MEEEDLDSVLYTPTWAIAAVCAVFIVCSLAVERAIFFIGHILRMHNQTSLSAALEKIKEELMVVGFISLALTVGQRSVAKICVPKKFVDFMPQCKKPSELMGKNSKALFEQTGLHKGVACAEGKVPFINLEGLHQLHILLFVLAIVHVIYSIMIMALGMWKVHQWKAWEERAHIAESLRAHGQIRLTRDVTFIRRHASGMWSKNWLSAYVAAFFQQFFRSVSETDYLTLRHGFLKKHKLKGFNFHKYILRTLEDDFKHVVGISPSLWGYMVLLTFLNVQGWGLYFWVSFIPLIMVLAIGTKLRHIITKMAVQCFEKHAVVEGLPDVKPTDELFWFGSPRLILYLIHYILFQDALELSLHFWTTFEFSSGSCFYKHQYILLGRLLLGALAQLICGYVMLPIYALVSQMGSEMKGSDDHGREYTQMVSLKLEESSQSKGRGPVSKPSEDIPAVSGLDAMRLPRDVESQHLQKQENGESSPRDEIKEDEGRHGTEVVDGSPRLQKKMSFIQRVARGVQGGDYHTLAIPGSNEKPL
ncbi:hypothetical protein GOP47_0025423 [Adiantum capillus-veneris]|uniref:MLO-like protein n=1 Tax=Adiantum capillus-veneris TaxID=13818 RepID=A0A9D4U0D4_ADICA|nr:hypothetical protein GOP47_0025423 [Adiantum capillus-veneris]